MIDYNIIPLKWLSPSEEDIRQNLYHSLVIIFLNLFDEHRDFVECELGVIWFQAIDFADYAEYQTGSSLIPIREWMVFYNEIQISDRLQFIGRIDFLLPIGSADVGDESINFRFRLISNRK